MIFLHLKTMILMTIPNEILISSLSLSLQTELFSLHQKNSPTQANLKLFKHYKIPVKLLNPQHLNHAHSLPLSDDQLSFYLQLLEHEESKFPAFSGNTLIDGLCRITSAKHYGLNCIPVLDFGELLNPHQSRTRIQLPLYFISRPKPSFPRNSF